MSESREPKKRSRVALSCNYCKKRKVKCDRGKPCSSCVRYKVPNLCEYPEPRFADQGGEPPAGESYRHERDPPNNIGMLPTFSIQKLNERSKPEPKRVQTHAVYQPAAQAASQPTFSSHPQPPPQNHHAQAPALSAYPPPAAPQAPGLRSELELLKEKIKTIEASLSHKDSSPASTHVPVVPPATVPEDRPPTLYAPSPGPFQTSPIPSTPNPIAASYNYPQTPVGATSGSRLNFPGYHSHVPIQLPPINLPHNNNDTAATQEESAGEKKHNYTDAAKTLVGVNPCVSEDDTLNFYEGYTPIHIKDEARRMNFGPFAWLSLIKKDSGLVGLWKFMFSSKFEYMRTAKQKKVVLLSSVLTFKPMSHEEEVSDENEAEAEFRERAIDRDGYNDLRSYDKKSKNGKKSETSSPDRIQLQRSAMNKNAISLGLTLFEGQIDQELQLIEKIKIILPKKKVIWTLISKFFKTVYPYLPFIDEDDFRAQMTRLLGPESFEDEKLDVLTVERRLDFAHLGILLILLRLTYVSLFSNKNAENEANLKTTDPSLQAQTLKYLLLNPINIDIVDMAQLCLDQFELLRKTSLVVMQCALFMRCYHMFSPEDGDGSDGGDSQIFNGMLTQMAYSIGLNREPDLYEDLAKDGKTNNLGRKIWYFLVISDVSQAYKYGNPINIDSKYNDTKAPYFRPESSNVHDHKMEENVALVFRSMYVMHEKMIPLMEMCLNVRQTTKLHKIMEKVSELEYYLSENHPPLRKFATPYDAEVWKFPFNKVYECRKILMLETFFLTIFFHLHLHYEKEKQYDFSFFYLKKIMSIACVELVPSFCPLIFNNSVNFGEAADMILNPTLESAIHRVCQLIMAVLVRVNAQIYKMKHDANHHDNLRTDFQYKAKFAKLCRFSKVQERLMKFCMVAMSRLSQRYYYAWRVTKANTFLLKLIIGEDFYKTLEKDEISFIPMSLDQLDELIHIGETAMRKYGRKAKMINAVGDLLDDVNAEDIEIGAKMSMSAGNVANSSHGKFSKSQKMTSSGRPVKNSVSSMSSAHSPFSHNSGGLTSNYPSSVDSASNSEMEELQFIENADIDRLWLQMANMKNDNTVANVGYDQEHHGHEGPVSSTPMVFNPVQMIPTPVLNPLSPDSLNNNNNLKNHQNGASAQGDDYQFNFPMTSHDIFNNFPIDQLLGVDGVGDSW